MIKLKKLFKDNKLLVGYLCICSLLICFAHIINDLVTYANDTVVSQVYNFESLQAGDVIKFDSKLEGILHWWYYPNGDDLKSVRLRDDNIAPIHYCIDSSCVDRGNYLYSDSTMPNSDNFHSYKVLSYKDVFGSENDEVIGWKVAFKKNIYHSYYSDRINGYYYEMILYPALCENECLTSEETVTKFYKKGKVDYLSSNSEMHSNRYHVELDHEWIISEDSYFFKKEGMYLYNASGECWWSCSTTYPFDTEIKFTFETKKESLIKFRIKYDIWDLYYTLNGVSVRPSFVEQFDGYKIAYIEVKDPGEYELRIYNSYIRESYAANTYLSIEDVEVYELLNNGKEIDSSLAIVGEEYKKVSFCRDGYTSVDSIVYTIEEPEVPEVPSSPENDTPLVDDNNSSDVIIDREENPETSDFIYCIFLVLAIVIFIISYFRKNEYKI